MGDIYREGKRNASGRRLFNTTQEYYTPELRELVEKKCARELNVFGYDFEGSCKHANFIVPTGLKYDVAGDRLYSVESDARCDQKEGVQAKEPKSATLKCSSTSNHASAQPSCPGGCGFAVTWHKTHCCAACALSGQHGPRCVKKKVSQRKECSWRIKPQRRRSEAFRSEVRARARN